MKLLTTGGLLYSTVLGQNADGTKGSYEKLDWVAMFPETANVELLTTKMNVGWDPMVTSVITTYDGGKAIGGFGKLSGTLYASWVMKMWGSLVPYTLIAPSANEVVCGFSKKITGYVTMKTLLNVNLLAADCVLTADASVQWAWTSLTSSGVATAIGGNNPSIALLALCEEWSFGNDGANGSAPIYITMGGSTHTNLLTWGLASWGFWAEHLDMNGLVASDASGGDQALTNGNASYVATLLTKASYGATANSLFSDTNTDTKIGVSGTMMTNGCWTVCLGIPNTSAGTSRAGAGGSLATAHSCIKIAVDGYSQTG